MAYAKAALDAGDRVVLTVRRTGPQPRKAMIHLTRITGIMPLSECRCRCGSPEPPGRVTHELETRNASAFLEQYEARFGQHPLLPGGQAPAGLPFG